MTVKRWHAILTVSLITGTVAACSGSSKPAAVDYSQAAYQACQGFVRSAGLPVKDFPSADGYPTITGSGNGPYEVFGLVRTADSQTVFDCYTKRVGGRWVKASLAVGDGVGRSASPSVSASSLVEQVKTLAAKVGCPDALVVAGSGYAQGAETAECSDPYRGIFVFATAGEVQTWLKAARGVGGFYVTGPNWAIQLNTSDDLAQVAKQTGGSTT